MTGRIVFAHGFTQTARTWDTVVDLLPAGLDPLAVDLPGHASASEVTTDLWGAATRVVDTGGPGIYVGYSMGGRVALHAALARPDLVERLVLIGATAGISDDAERSLRRASDIRLADHVEQIGVEEFVDEWLQNPLFAGLSAHTDQRDDRVRNSATGLASSLRTCGTGCQEPLWERLGEVSCPTLLLVGERDHKFRELADRLAAGIDDARVEVIGGVGHSVHLEAPEATAQAIQKFSQN